MKTQFILNKALQAETMRFTVISDNIANVNTPNFKRSDVTFESQLQRALESENPYPFKASRTHEKHIPFYQPIDYRTVSPKVNLEYNTVNRNDKNNVDIDKELVDAAKSTMRFNAYSSLLSRQFKKIGLLLRG